MIGNGSTELGERLQRTAFHCGLRLFLLLLQGCAAWVILALLSSFPKELDGLGNTGCYVVSNERRRQAQFKLMRSDAFYFAQLCYDFATLADLNNIFYE